jgi:hypothetical protein
MPFARTLDPNWQEITPISGVEFQELSDTEAGRARYAMSSHLFEPFGRQRSLVLGPEMSRAANRTLDRARHIRQFPEARLVRLDAGVNFLAGLRTDNHQ